MHISLVRSRTAVYIAMDTTINPTINPIAMTTPIKFRSNASLFTVSSDVNSSIV